MALYRALIPLIQNKDRVEFQFPEFTLSDLSCIMSRKMFYLEVLPTFSIAFYMKSL